MEGSLEFTYGGELIEPYYRKSASGEINERELGGKGIKDGITITVKSGDWLWIPAGEPHQHNAKDFARLILIKIPKD
jgi:hypothetical protein